MSIYRVIDSLETDEQHRPVERRSQRGQEFRATFAAFDEYIRNERRDTVLREQEFRERIAVLAAELLERVRQLDAFDERELRTRQENERLRKDLARRTSRPAAHAEHRS